VKEVAQDDDDDYGHQEKKYDELCIVARKAKCRMMSAL
jgi:hypothetical protein